MKNSFYDRAVDAAVTWDTVLRPMIPSGKGLSWIGVVSSSNTAQIAIRNLTLTGAYAGANAVTDVGSGCYVNTKSIVQPTTPMPGSVYITVNTFSYWFTQDNTRRSLWESCSPKAPNATTYTCGKSLDFGSTITHELGHAVGLPHPEAVNTIVDYQTAAQEGRCSSNNDRATMCAFSVDYATHKRTLASWDTYSLSWQY